MREQEIFSANMLEESQESVYDWTLFTRWMMASYYHHGNFYYDYERRKLVNGVGRSRKPFDNAEICKEGDDDKWLDLVVAAKCHM